MLVTSSFRTLNTNIIMNDNPFSDKNANPSGSTTAPSPSDAASDLRNAAGDFAKDAGDTASKFKDSAIETAGSLKASAAEKAEHYRALAMEKADHLKESAQHQWEDTCDKAKEMQVTAEDYIRQNPTKAVLGAVGVGFLIGLITRR